MRLHDQVGILNPTDGVKNDRGSSVVTWDAPEIPSRALVSPLSTQENTIGENTTVTRWRVFLPAVTAATARSRVRWRGDLYEVDGEVELHTSSRGRPHHHEALLRRVSST